MQERISELERRLAEIGDKKDAWDIFQIIASLLVPASIAFAGCYFSAAIAEGRRKWAERTEITKDRVLQELARLAFANMADYMKVGAVRCTERCSVPVLDYRNPDYARMFWEWAHPGRHDLKHDPGGACGVSGGALWGKAFVTTPGATTRTSFSTIRRQTSREFQSEIHRGRAVAARGRQGG
ncbi:MAG: hypothetical protein GWO40_15265 [Gammaproteobacteria bacterium]|nr:hypothetical protein [Gammaproteobacteria bacterium]NIX86894.1 hypothetical protein [Gammaproteobacteria bacterium]